MPEFMLQVFEALTQRYDSEELRTLCFLLRQDFPQLNYESLPGEGKEAKARELIEYFIRRNSLPQLIDKILEQRPDLQGTFVTDKPARVVESPHLLAHIERASTAITDGNFDLAERVLESALFLAEELNLNPYLTKIVHQSVSMPIIDRQSLNLLSTVSLERLTTIEDWLYLTAAKILIRLRLKRHLLGMRSSAIAMRAIETAVQLTKELIEMEPDDEYLQQDLSRLESEKVKMQNERVEIRIERAVELATQGNKEQAILFLKEAIELPSTDYLKVLATRHLEELIGE